MVEFPLCRSHRQNETQPGAGGAEWPAVRTPAVSRPSAAVSTLPARLGVLSIREGFLENMVPSQVEDGPQDTALWGAEPDR